MLCWNCLGLEPNTRPIWQTVYFVYCIFSTKHGACHIFSHVRANDFCSRVPAFCHVWMMWDSNKFTLSLFSVRTRGSVLQVFFLFFVVKHMWKKPNLGAVRNDENCRIGPFSVLLKTVFNAKGHFKDIWLTFWFLSVYGKTEWKLYFILKTWTLSSSVKKRKFISMTFDPSVVSHHCVCAEQ